MDPEAPKRIRDEIKADEDCAVVLIKMDRLRNLEGLQKIVETMGARILTQTPLGQDLVLLKLNVADMRDIALKLTENGYDCLKGINASRHRGKP